MIGFHLSHPGQISLCVKEEHGVVVRVKGGSDKGGQEEGWVGQRTFHVWVQWLLDRSLVKTLTSVHERELTWFVQI